MFERFTDRARRVLVLAQEEARLLNHSFIGTEHILLGLIHEGEGVAAKALKALGISLETVREKVAETIGPAGPAATGSPPFTPRAKKALELSLREAQQLGHQYIGVEHLLLGLIREGDGAAAQVLQSLGADLPRVRQQVIRLLPDNQEGGDDIRSHTSSGSIHGAVAFQQFRHPERVIAGPSERMDSGDLQFQVIGVLIYDEGIEVIWQSGIPKPLTVRGKFQDASGESKLLPLRVTDDVGSPYTYARGFMDSLSEEKLAGHTLFSPAPPDGAHHLRVQWEGQSVEIEI